MTSKFAEITAAAMPCSESLYSEARDALPPIRKGNMWAMGEPMSHTGTGEPVYYWFATIRGVRFACIGTCAEASAAFYPFQAMLKSIPVAGVAGNGPPLC